MRSTKGYRVIFSQDCFRKAYTGKGKVVFLVRTYATQQTKSVSEGWHPPGAQTDTWMSKQEAKVVHKAPEEPRQVLKAQGIFRVMEEFGV